VGCVLPGVALLREARGAGDGLKLDERALSLLLVFVEVGDLRVLMGMLLVLEGEVVHSVVFVKPAALDALDDLLPVHVVFPVNDLNDLLLYHDVLTLEVDEVRMAGLITQAEIRSLQVPKPCPVL